MVPLVLVEGLPGCGKSTTAQFLARQLRRAGYRARWHYEEETPHPVFRRPAESTTWEGYFSEIVARREGTWQAAHLRKFDASEYAAAHGVSGVDGWLAYWREHAVLAEAAVSRSPLSVLVVDVAAGDWESR